MSKLDMANIKEARPVDDSAALVPFGWAPGGYIAVCARCGDTHGGCEKRAPRCQDCAEWLRDNPQGPPPMTSTREPDCPKRGEIRVIDGKLLRFIERELEGDKWEVLGAAPASDLEQVRRERDGLRKALERQTVNMAFILNRVDLHKLHDKFEQEMTEDRQCLHTLMEGEDG